MDQMYFVSRDGGSSSKGPFTLDQVRGLYLQNLLPLAIHVKQQGGTSWIAIDEFAPDWVSKRNGSSVEMDQMIKASERAAIREEHFELWRGLFWLCGGLFVTIGSWYAAGSNPSGGTVTIMYGAVGAGLIKFLANLKSVLERRRARLSRAGKEETVA